MSSISQNYLNMSGKLKNDYDWSRDIKIILDEDCFKTESVTENGTDSGNIETEVLTIKEEDVKAEDFVYPEGFVADEKESSICKVEIEYNEISRDVKMEVEQKQNTQNKTKMKGQTDGEIEGNSYKKTVYQKNDKSKIGTVKNSYNCAYCFFGSNSLLGIRNHVLKHNMKSHRDNDLEKQIKALKTLKCAHCDFYSENQVLMREHILTHKTFKCNICDYETYKLTFLKRHVANKTLDKHRRHFESLKGTPINELSDTKEKKKEDKDQRCKVGNEEPVICTPVRQKEGVKVSNKIYKCNQCEWQTNVPKILKLHAKTHEDKSLLCNICDCLIGSEAGLKLHMRIHKMNRSQKKGRRKDSAMQFQK